MVFHSPFQGLLFAVALSGSVEKRQSRGVFHIMESVIEQWGGREIFAADLYGDIFRLGRGFIQREWEEPGSHKANPLILGEKDGQMHRKILFEDTFMETLAEFQEYDWAITNGLTYWGRENTGNNQSKMCAMIFDLDGTDATRLNRFFSGSKAGAYPWPTYVILSGHNVHLYYVFEEPLSLFPETKRQLKELKYALTTRMWNEYTSSIKKVQFQGINQGFRIVGGKTKIDGVRVRAFKMSDHPTTIEELNDCVPPESRMDVEKIYRESKIDWDAAAKKWPEWAARIQAKEPGHGWDCKEDLYEWWKRKILEGAAPGHRYYCIMALVVYAAKCGIWDEERVRADALSFVPFLNDLKPDEPFTETDAMSAMDCLDLRYKTFPRKDLEKISNIRIEANKRNFRKQEVHLGRMRALQTYDDPEGKWRYHGGAPTKQKLIQDYAEEHPGATQREIAAALGVSSTTVNKWVKLLDDEN